MSTFKKVVGETWQHRSATAVTLLSAGVMLIGLVLVGVGLIVLALVMLLWAVAPLLGGGFMAWFAEQQPVRTVAGWMLTPALGAAVAALPLLLRARAEHQADAAAGNVPCGTPSRAGPLGRDGRGHISHE